MLRTQECQSFLHILTGYNGINKAVLQQKLGCLEILGEGCICCLLDHALACKTNQCLRLCQNDITLHGKGIYRLPA